MPCYFQHVLTSINKRSICWLLFEVLGCCRFEKWKFTWNRIENVCVYVWGGRVPELFVLYKPDKLRFFNVLFQNL